MCSRMRELVSAHTCDTRGWEFKSRTEPFFKAIPKQQFCQKSLICKAILACLFVLIKKTSLD